MKKKSFLPKAALAAITIWGGLVVRLTTVILQQVNFGSLI
jgi:hypothetical protein